MGRGRGREKKKRGGGRGGAAKDLTIGGKGAARYCDASHDTADETGSKWD